MIDLDTNKRGSGRTTSMLFAAARATLDCKSPNDRVCIVVHSEVFKAEIKRELEAMFSTHVCSKIIVLHAGNHLVKRTAVNKYDCCAAMYNNKATLVDHHVWYKELQDAQLMLTEFNKYDRPQ